MVVFEFLKMWWKPLAGGLIVALAFLYVGHLKSTIADQDKTISTLTLENTIVKANNAKLETALGANNLAIQKLSEGADTTKKAFSTLNTNVTTKLTGLDSRLKSVLADKKPATCEQTIQYLIDASKDYQK